MTQLRNPKLTVMEPLRGTMARGALPLAECERCGIRRSVNHSRPHRLCKDCRQWETDPQWHEMMEAQSA